MAATATAGLFFLAREGVHAILLSAGWRRHGLTFGAGVLSAAAMPPLDLFPALLLGLPVLVWLLDGQGGSGRSGWRDLASAALTGWWFGFGYFLAGLWWLGVAFVTGGEQFVWLMPLGVIGLPAALALFFALGLAIARLLWSPGALRIFSLAFGLGVSEWLRGWLFTGFPWNGFGQAFANHFVLAQGASVVGADGLGIIVIALFASPAVIFTGANRAGRYLAPALAIAVFAAMTVFGLMRLHASGGIGVDFSVQKMVPDVRIRIMQPNIAQDEKHQQKNGAAILEQFFALSDRAKGAHAGGIGDVTHLVWPESPFPFVLERSAPALEAIGRFLPPQTQLITGAIRAEPSEGAPRGFRFFNAMHVINRSGIVGTYDKVHLVPFGEYLPFEGVLRAIGLEQFVRVVGGFTASPARRPLDVLGLPPVIPMICFESIFSRELGAEAPGGRILLNVTNDAWFGYTFGPYQHLAQARLRAIEFGQPVIRAANSGISAVFDPYGRVIAKLPLGIADVLDSPLPEGLPNTLYRRATWYSFAAVMICFAAAALIGRGR